MDRTRSARMYGRAVRVSGAWIQVDMFSNDLTVIVQTILEVTPAGDSVDVSELEDALDDIEKIKTDFRDVREDMDSVFQTIQKVVLAVGMSVVFCAVTSGLSLVTRVRLKLCALEPC